MNSLNMIRAIDEFLDGLSEAAAFLDYLEKISIYSKKISGGLELIAAGGSGKFVDAANQIHTHFLNLNGLSINISPSQFYIELEQLKKVFSKINENFGIKENSLIFDLVLRELKFFSDIYDKYLNSKNAENSRKVLVCAVDLNSIIKSTVDTLRAISVSMKPSDISDAESSQISIILPEHYSLKDFAERLLALQSMYSELCALFHVNENDHPLRIGKVESGSLWAWLFGDTKIIELISIFIKQGASFAYRNFTAEGKISALPKKMETIDAMLNLTQRLEAAGFNTAEMKPNIEKAAFAISRDLATLIDGQTSITVNNEKLSLHDELTKALLERREVRLLESNPEQGTGEGPKALPD